MPANDVAEDWTNYCYGETETGTVLSIRAYKA
jgi:hypothetical protein